MVIFCSDLLVSNTLQSDPEQVLELPSHYLYYLSLLPLIVVQSFEKLAQLLDAA